MNINLKYLKRLAVGITSIHNKPGDLILAADFLQSVLIMKITFVFWQNCQDKQHAIIYSKIIVVGKYIYCKGCSQLIQRQVVQW